MYTKDVMINHLPFEIFRSIFQQVIAIIEHLVANVMKLVSMHSWPESHLSECLDLLVKWQNQRNRVWSFITVAICNIVYDSFEFDQTPQRKFSQLKCLLQHHSWTELQQTDFMIFIISRFIEMIKHRIVNIATMYHSLITGENKTL